MAASDKTEIQDDDAREDARQMSLQGNEPPSEIEGYSILRRLGTGSYGTVWLAREDNTGRMVAIKYYPHRRGLNWSLLNREVEKLATLYSSRNIVRLLDVGWNAEPPYYVMEYVENGSLGAQLTSGPVSAEQTVRIAREVCNALIEAHGAGVLHCDLKPDNVLLDGQYQVRLCDFGQSRMSHEQSPSLGTLYYMAPEQADTEAVPDARWDVYAVGALMYHMLTGQAPYRDAEIQQRLENAENLQERLLIYKEHIQSAPPPREHRSVRGVDRHLASIIDQCIAADPRERLPNAQAIRTQLMTRDRNRSRRPLLALGILGSFLLIAAMIPVFVRTMNRIISDAEEQQTADVLDSNQLTARSQASALQRELEYRLEALEDVVADPELIAELSQVMQRDPSEVAAEVKANHDKPHDQLPSWMQLLDSEKEKADRRLSHSGRSPDTSWFLTDAKGNQLWRRNFDPKTIGRNYAWRDYFHGLNQQFDPDRLNPDLRPISGRHVSLAFISQGTKRYMVALSVPVFDAEKRVIGVFARTLHLGELQDRLGQDLHGNSTSRVIALADGRNLELLDHPSLTDEIFENMSTASEAEQLFQRLKLQLDQDVAKKVAAVSEQHAASREAIDIQVREYVDPIVNLNAKSASDYGGNYIAAISTNQLMPWLVIVQQDRGSALKPVRAMQDRASRQGWIALVATIGTTFCVWIFVWFSLARTNDSRIKRNHTASTSE